MNANAIIPTQRQVSSTNFTVIDPITLLPCYVILVDLSTHVILKQEKQ